MPLICSVGRVVQFYRNGVKDKKQEAILNDINQEKFHLEITSISEAYQIISSLHSDEGFA